MTTSIDRLVARAMDRAPVARPVIAPLFARAAREPEPLEPPAPDDPSAGVGRAASSDAPSDARPAVRRGSLEQWLATHAPMLAAGPSRSPDDAPGEASSDGAPRTARDTAGGPARELPASAAADGAPRPDPRQPSPAAIAHVVDAAPREAHEVAPRREPPLPVRATRPPRAIDETPRAAQGPAASPAASGREAPAPVRVTIGRVVVRAVLPPAPPAPPAPSPHAGPTLEEYLARGGRP